VYGSIDPGEHVLGSTVQGSSHDEADGRALVKDDTLSGDSRFELLQEPTPTSR